MLKGTYVFKQNGIEVGRSQNLITTNGRKVILQNLAGVKTEWASNLSIGAIPTAPTVNDVQLNYETGRYPVTLKTYQSATLSTPDLIIVRATLPTLMSANIYEVGIYPENSTTSASNRNNNILVDFSDLTNWVVDLGSIATNSFTPGADHSPRIGNYSVSLTQNTSMYNNTFSLNFSDYSELDTMQILARNTVAGFLTMTVTDTDGFTADFVYSLADSSDYQILTKAFPATIKNANGDLLTLSTKALGPIKSIRFTTDSTAAVTIDAVKTSTLQELRSNDFIISKSILNTPIPKIYGTALDVEYYIELL
jgi:hypothetical protein